MINSFFFSFSFFLVSMFCSFFNCCWLLAAAATITAPVVVDSIVATATKAERLWFCSLANLKKDVCPDPSFNKKGLLCGQIKQVRQLTFQKEL